MDEELMNLSTEETFETDIEDIIESEIKTEDLEQNIETEETLDVVEVETVEEIDIVVDEAIGWVGGDSTRHYSLYGRDEYDQHPITAITGLRAELDEIEKLQTVYSDNRSQANYYKWKDENILQENRVGYFVSMCEDINKIQICTGDNVFGVTVDAAGFIGGQSEVPRDITYGLVVCDGIAAVRCELDVLVDDYVIPNNYGMAQRVDNDYGYKVVALQDIGGVKHAVINLQIEINKIRDLADSVNNLDERVGEAESNIVSAINMANAAYNKAGEAEHISEEALKDALESLKKSEETSEIIKDLENNISQNNTIAIEAREIANSACNAAITAKDEAIATSNEAAKNVNDLIKDLEPITTWTDPESGNIGAEYLTNYINNGLATNIYVSEINTKTEENKSAIQINAESIQNMIFSIDKYSVGEYSQSYGLTHEQAVSILKEGMIYIPTEHLDTPSHSETFEDTGEINEFTPTNYYEWNGNDWIEYLHSVAFSSEKPTVTGTLKYWYIDSDTAPIGYEPHTLYMYEDGKWVKVNIFFNNPSNRMVSSISQEVDGISAEIVNARGSYSGLDARLTNVDSQLQLATFWNNPDSGKGNLATVKLDSDDDSSSLALVVMGSDGEKQISGASIVLGQDGAESYIQLDASQINFTAEDYRVISDNIDLTGYVTIESLKGDGTTEINGSNITTGSIQSGNYVADTSGMKLNLADGTWDSKYFKIDTEGNIAATGGTIGGWTIGEDQLLYGNDNNYFNKPSNDKADIVLKIGDNFEVYGDGKLWTSNIYAKGGEIGGCTFDDDGNLEVPIANIKGELTVGKISFGISSFYIDPTGNSTYYLHLPSLSISPSGQAIFSGELFAAGGTFSGELSAATGSFSGSMTCYSGNYTTTIDNGYIELEHKYNNYNLYGMLTGAFYNVSGGPLGQAFECGLSPYYKQAFCGIASHNIIFTKDNAELSGTWIGTSDLPITSDETRKNNISSPSDEYEILFDNLNPVVYKYNDGTSGRLHTGYTSQGVCSAIEKAGLTTQDFAGYVLATTINQETGEEETFGRLRYGEFVSLNTWQIQKAKARITELETQVASLTDRLEALEKGE